MTYLNIKTVLVATLMATSAFASSIPLEEESQGKIVPSQGPMGAGDFDLLTPDVMGYVASWMPETLESAQNLVTVCKYFHAYFVPHMSFAWTPMGSIVPTGGNFARAYAPRIVRLDLSYNKNFTDAFLQDFINLTCLNLMDNKIVTDEAVKNLTNLTDLSLGYNRVITEGTLKELTKLTSLDLFFNTTVTDEAVKNLTNLRDLNLRSNNAVTDKGLKNLSELSCLTLNKDSTVTPAGYAHLPGLEIVKHRY
jgi:hypothetical protein